MANTFQIDNLIEADLLDMLDLLHSKTSDELLDARNSLESYRDRVETLEAKLQRIEERMAKHRTPTKPAKPQLTPRGRVKKGQSKPLIVNFVKESNGVGVSIQQIITATGTKYGTIRRILRELEGSQVEQMPNSKWRWKREDLSATKKNGEAGANANGEAKPLL